MNSNKVINNKKEKNIQNNQDKTLNNTGIAPDAESNNLKLIKELQESLVTLQTQNEDLLQVQKELLKSRKQVAEQIQIQSQLLNSVGEAVIATDLSGKVSYWSNSAQKIYGWTREETIGRDIFEIIKPVVPISKEQILLESQKSEGLNTNIIAYRRDNSTIEVSVHNRPILNEKGQVIGIMGVSWDITEQKRIEDSLQRSEAKLRAIFDAIPDGIAVTDLNGIMTDVNSAVVKMHNSKSKEELIGKSAFDLIAPEDKEKARNNLLTCLTEGSHCATEYKVLKSDGTTFPVELTPKVITNDKNQPIGFVAVTRDISERKLSEIKAQQYIDNLLALSRAATALVEQTSEEDIYQLIAEQIQRLVSDKIFVIVNSYDEVSNASQTRAFKGPPDKLHDLNMLLKRNPIGMSMPLSPSTIQRLKSGEVIKIEAGIFTAATNVLPKSTIEAIERLLNIQCTYSMGFSWQGKMYGSILILITEGCELPNLQIVKTFVEQSAIALQRQQAQEALAKAKSELEIMVTKRTSELTDAVASLKMEINIRTQIEEELRKSERFNASLLENAPNPILVIRSDRKISFVNKAFEELTGFSSKEAVGIKAPFPWWPPGKKREYSQRFDKVRTQKINQFERLLRKKNGELFWVEVTSTYIPGDEDNIFDEIIIWQDITQRKKAEEQLLAYQKELRSLASQLTLAEENERRNIASLIHAGVTQLLALCVMKMEVLLKTVGDPNLSNSLNEIYKIIQQAIEDTRNLTFELSPPSLYDLGLDAALEELIERFAKEGNLNATFDSDGQPKPLNESTSVILFQAVNELLHNVVKHAKARNVDISSQRLKNNIQITVTDDGIGFDLKAFTESRKRDMSLGIFGIRERFRYIGGNLRIKSSPGKGSRFTLIAPLKENRVKAKLYRKNNGVTDAGTKELPDRSRNH